MPYIIDVFTNSDKKVNICGRLKCASNKQGNYADNFYLVFISYSWRPFSDKVQKIFFSLSLNSMACVNLTTRRRKIIKIKILIVKLKANWRNSCKKQKERERKFLPMRSIVFLKRWCCFYCRKYLFPMFNKYFLFWGDMGNGLTCV